MSAPMAKQSGITKRRKVNNGNGCECYVTITEHLRWQLMCNSSAQIGITQASSTKQLKGWSAAEQMSAQCFSTRWGLVPNTDRKGQQRGVFFWQWLEQERKFGDTHLLLSLGLMHFLRK